MVYNKGITHIKQTQTNKINKMRKLILITLVLASNVTLANEPTKEDKKTRIERREDRQKAKAIANVKKWKSEAGHTVYCSQIAPNK